MPSMTREDALTKLAMEVAEWPSTSSVPGLTMGMTWTNHGAWLCWPQPKGSRPISLLSWHKERERLINKPSWDDAPEWAESLGQCSDGGWEWYEDENPECAEEYWNHELKGVPSEKGLCPTGHDWRTTLELRPNSKKPALSEECTNSAIDAVNHPQHYQSETGIECIDAIRASLGKEGFIAYCRGSAQKYAWRTGKKKEHAEDLRKAVWYLERAAKEMEE